MENEVLELCKKVIDGETPFNGCHYIDCSECVFDDMKSDCSINSAEAREIAQNYINEHEKTVENIKEEHKYKIGDKVRIRSDLKVNTWYDGVWLNNSMVESVNKILTIKKLDRFKAYRVEENIWLWSENMLEPVEEENEYIDINLIEGNHFKKSTVTLKELQDIKKDDIIPAYYQKGNYDIIQFCIDNDIDFIAGNIIKYIIRYNYKNNIEDLKKAKEYMGRSNKMEYETPLSDLVNFNLENNLNYTQGKIIELTLDGKIEQAENLLDDLIEKEEKIKGAIYENKE